MKIYISVDMEGIAGVTHWDECTKNHADYKHFQQQMTDEVRAACEAANRAGATEIYIKDAHASARNILAESLPSNTYVIRGWSGHPYLMMQEIDESFAAVLFIGYHDRAHSGGNPLAHTLSSKRVHFMRLNGELVSEFVINSYTAALHQIPVVFISGDAGICQSAEKFHPSIATVSTMTAAGNSMICRHPEHVIHEIAQTVESTLQAPLLSRRVQLPDTFELELGFKDHASAYRGSFFPGVELTNSHTIRFHTSNYFEILRALQFLVY